jgi:phage FluMu gp28-like protein
MYHINTACTKAILSTMPKEEFLQEFIKIRERYMETPENHKQHFKYASLYNWCLNHYRNKLQYQKPHRKRIA